MINIVLNQYFAFKLSQYVTEIFLLDSLLIVSTTNWFYENQYFTRLLVTPRAGDGSYLQ